jgi:hypothetical protein
MEKSIRLQINDNPCNQEYYPKRVPGGRNDLRQWQQELQGERDQKKDQQICRGVNFWLVHGLQFLSK